MFKRFKDNFDAVQGNYQHINFVYLTYEEYFPKKDDSIKYFEVTKKKLKPYGVFCLKNSRMEGLRGLTDGEWERFVNYLNNSL